MRFRHSTAGGPDKVELQMTPMIDVVFQLLAFFMFSLKIASNEGDFNIKMPLAAPSSGLPDPESLPPLRLRLLANAEGGLAGLQLGETQLPNFAALHQSILELIGTDAGPASAAPQIEIELDFDYHLHYQHVIQAITAIAGYLDADGNIVKLVDRIKFAPPKPPPTS
jgi:biopolymer transport protein ExbD